MVAINFTGWWTEAAAKGQNREAQRLEVFAKIQLGKKTSTIRSWPKGPRCKPGDKLQLYWGMRTKDCVKIMDAECISAERVYIHPQEEMVTSSSNPEGIGTINPFSEEELERLFLGDGFPSKSAFFSSFEKGSYYLVNWRKA